MKMDVASGFKGGKGEINMLQLLKKDEMAGKGRLYNKITIKPGMSIGMHKHEGEFEVFYVIAGEGLLDDNGVKSVLKKGDLSVTRSGESHSIENAGSSDLEMIALILFE